VAVIGSVNMPHHRGPARLSHHRNQELDPQLDVDSALCLVLDPQLDVDSALCLVLDPLQQQDSISDRCQ
jgi:hypothetical protein